jgi:hypothetical protein
MDQGLAPCEEILRRQSPLPAHCREGSWEVGRLVLSPEYRSGAEALKRCLVLTFHYLVRTTNIQNGFAMCSPVLSRLYRRFGFSVLAKDAWQDAAGSMSLIHGSVAAVLQAMTGDDGQMWPRPRESAWAGQMGMPQE